MNNAATPLKALTVYLKLSNFCNIGCDHCYLPEKIRRNKSKMSLEMISSILQVIKYAIEKESFSHITIIWHGGEPLLLPVDYLLMVFEKINQTIASWKTKVTASHLIQTALLPLEEKHLPFLKRCFNSQVGTSIDFTQRQIKGNSQNYIDQWIKKVDFARENGLMLYPIVVPTKQETKKADELIQWFISHHFPKVSFERYNQFNEQHTASLRPSNNEYAGFLIDCFDITMNHIKEKKPTLMISELSAAILGVLENQPGKRWGTRCQTSTLVFDVNGQINTCPDRMNKEPSIASITQPLSTILNSKDRREHILEAALYHPAHHCYQCPYFSWCKSGCPITENLQTNDACSGYKPLLDHIKHYCAKSQRNRQTALNYAKNHSSAKENTVGDLS